MSCSSEKSANRSISWADLLIILLSLRISFLRWHAPKVCMYIRKSVDYPRIFSLYSLMVHAISGAGQSRIIARAGSLHKDNHYIFLSLHSVLVN